MRNQKIAYWIFTGLLCGLMLFSASMYLFNHEEVKGFFVALGFPTYIIYPLAGLKILGVVAIVTRKSQMLKEWAYAGIFFDLVLAASAHIMISDGQQGGAILGLVLLVVSYVLQKRIFVQKTERVTEAA